MQAMMTRYAIDSPAVPCVVMLVVFRESKERRETQNSIKASQELWERNNASKHGVKGGTGAHIQVASYQSGGAHRVHLATSLIAAEHAGSAHLVSQYRRVLPFPRCEAHVMQSKSKRMRIGTSVLEIEHVDVVVRVKYLSRYSVVYVVTHNTT